MAALINAYVINHFMKNSKMLVLASVAQAQCDNILNQIVLELKDCSLVLFFVHEYYDPVYIKNVVQM